MKILIFYENESLKKNKCNFLVEDVGRCKTQLSYWLVLNILQAKYYINKKSNKNYLKDKITHS